MIEVNLLPGGKKRGRRGGGRSFKLPSIKSFPADPYIIAAVVVALGVFGTVGWWYLGLANRRDEVQVALADAVQDSSNYVDLIERNNTLKARRDSIAQKVDIIQEIDAGRYVWPHVLDEVARALPDYTWLTQILQVTIGEVVEFQIHGKAGTPFALTTFMESLEASPFIRNVSLVQMEQEVDNQQLVYGFQLDASYEVPPVELIETVPLFEAEPSVGNP